jgi:deazaflavin-dependent oxidoreductase (nitroreductase family)
MVAPRGLAKFNRQVTNRILGTFAPVVPGFGVIVHTGRKSGKTYRTPVNIFAVDDTYVVALAYGTESDWVRNVLAAGGCDVLSRGRQLRLTDPEIVHDPSRHYVPALARPILAIVGVDDFLKLHG